MNTATTIFGMFKQIIQTIIIQTIIMKTTRASSQFRLYVIPISSIKEVKVVKIMPKEDNANLAINFTWTLVSWLTKDLWRRSTALNVVVTKMDQSVQTLQH